MDKRYEAYCLADPFFYDHPASREDLSPSFAHARRPAPAGWSAQGGGDWWHLMPDTHHLPDQGWKIHVSATPASATDVLDVLWEHCVAAGLPFKFLRSPGLLFLRNSKYAERGSSGKFATLYPADERELEATLARLDVLLTGKPGPYVLSDLRYGSGPLYVRYGAFTQRRCLDAAGESVPAIEDPSGRLVPDERGPVFAPPAWARLPAFLAPHLEARGAASVADLPYRIEQALHFSNGGGVYQGVDTRSGRKVVLKEARPHAGLLGDGSDAIARLERERDVLRLAAGSGAGPEVLDWFELGEHRFLVLEFVEGRTLNTHFSERYPLIGASPDPEAVRAYTEWALGIQVKVEDAVAALHLHGVVFNDLHLFNIMVRPDGSVTLIDFEVAAPVAEAARQFLAARAFQAPRELSGTAVDRYTLACLRLALFLPLTGLLPLDRGRAPALAAAIRGEFPDVPRAFLDEAVAQITGAGQGRRRIPGTPEPAACGQAADAALAGGDWGPLRAMLAESITAAASPERTDRLFPGDIRQFAHPGAGLGLAHGAAGVLYALHTTGATASDEYEHWLLRRIDTLPQDARVGLYDGVHGIAYVLDLLGHREAAHRLIALSLEERWQRLGPDLAEGLAGIRAEPAALLRAHRGRGPARRGAGGRAYRGRGARPAGRGPRPRGRSARLRPRRARGSAARGERCGAAVPAPLRAHRRRRLARPRRGRAADGPGVLHGLGPGRLAAGQRGLAGAAVSGRGRRGHRPGAAPLPRAPRRRAVPHGADRDPRRLALPLLRAGGAVLRARRADPRPRRPGRAPPSPTRPRRRGCRRAPRHLPGAGDVPGGQDASGESGASRSRRRGAARRGGQARPAAPARLARRRLPRHPRVPRRPAAPHLDRPGHRLGRRAARPGRLARPAPGAPAVPRSARRRSSAARTGSPESRRARARPASRGALTPPHSRPPAHRAPGGCGKSTTAPSGWTRQQRHRPRPANSPGGDMSLLDLQAMETPAAATRGGDGDGHGGHGGGSEVSLLLCDSTASVLLCL